MTIKQFYAESKLYPYSKDHLETLKNINELEILEQYIINQEAMTEYAVDLSDGFMSAYFQESMDDNMYQALMEEYKEKKDNTAKRIFSSIGKMIKRFIAWLGRMAHQFESLFSSEGRLLNSLRHVTLDTEMINKLIAAIQADGNADFMNATADVVQKMDEKLDLKYAPKAFAGAKYSEKKFESIMGAIFSRGTINLPTVALPNSLGQGRQLIPADKLIDIIKKMLKSKRVHSAVDDISNAKKTIGSNMIQIDANPKKLQKMIDTLNDLNSAVEELSKGSLNNTGTTGDTAASYKALEDAFAVVNENLADVIKLYTTYLNYRQHSIAAIKKVLGSKGEAAASDKEDDEEPRGALPPHRMFDRDKPKKEKKAAKKEPKEEDDEEKEDREALPPHKWFKRESADDIEDSDF